MFTSCCLFKGAAKPKPVRCSHYPTGPTIWPTATKWIWRDARQQSQSYSPARSEVHSKRPQADRKRSEWERCVCEGLLRKLVSVGTPLAWVNAVLVHGNTLAPFRRPNDTQPTASWSGVLSFGTALRSRLLFTTHPLPLELSHHVCWTHATETAGSSLCGLFLSTFGQKLQDHHEK